MLEFLKQEDEKAWVGGTYSKEYEKWINSDGAPSEKQSYPGLGEDAEGERCLQMNSDGELFATKCDEAFPYICQLVGKDNYKIIKLMF